MKRRAWVIGLILCATAGCGDDGPGVDDIVPPSTSAPAGSENPIVTDVTEPDQRLGTTDGTTP